MTAAELATRPAETPCPNCRGLGEVLVHEHASAPAVDPPEEVEDCERCGGTGKIEAACNDCGDLVSDCACEAEEAEDPPVAPAASVGAPFQAGDLVVLREGSPQGERFRQAGGPSGPYEVAGCGFGSNGQWTVMLPVDGRRVLCDAGHFVLAPGGRA